MLAALVQAEHALRTICPRWVLDGLADARRIITNPTKE